MGEPLERDQVVELLNALGSAKDEDALWAARSLHSKITQASMSWDELLVADESGNDESEDREELLGEELEDEDGVEDDTSKQSATSAHVNAVDDTETLTLIDKLLTRKGVSDDLQEELEGYKLDIANGEFESSDRNYVKALYSRLTKRG